MDNQKLSLIYTALELRLMRLENELESTRREMRGLGEILTDEQEDSMANALARFHSITMDYLRLVSLEKQAIELRSRQVSLSEEIGDVISGKRLY